MLYSIRGREIHFLLQFVVKIHLPSKVIERLIILQTNSKIIFISNCQFICRQYFSTASNIFCSFGLIFSGTI